MSDDRQRELALKRQRLEELRRQRKLREDHGADASKSSPPSQPQAPATPTQELHTDSLDDILRQVEADKVKKTAKKLSLALDVVVVNIPPEETETYEKQTQTDVLEEPESVVPEAVADDVSEPEVQDSTILEADHEEDEAMPKVLSEEDAFAVMAAPRFHKFFSDAARVCLRALHQKDVVVDYASESVTEIQKDRLYQMVVLADERCAGRPVTDVARKPLKRDSGSGSVSAVADLIAVSYGSEDAEGAHGRPSRGTVLLWSLNHQTLEYELECEGEVLKVMFHPDADNSAIYGGLANGQIVMWNYSDNSKPVYETSFLGKGCHVHPIAGMCWVEALSKFVTASTDGRICLWDPSKKLSEPEESGFLRNEVDTDVIEGCGLPILCIGVVPNSSMIFCGTESGCIYQYDLSKISTNPIAAVLKDENATGAVMAIDVHPRLGHSMILSGWTSWSAATWEIARKDGADGSVLGIDRQHLFKEFLDYVFDVCWSPTKKDMFAAVDSSGVLYLWDKTQTTKPIAQAEVDSSLNCVRWFRSTNDRDCILAGASSGALYIYGIPDESEQTQ